MTTLSDVLHQTISISETKRRFLQALNIDEAAQNALDWVKENKQETQIENKLVHMTKRNKQLEELNDVHSL